MVIKTTLADPAHDVLRRVIWKGREFPSRVDERTIQLDHLGIKMMHDALPFLSKGRFRSPDTAGYTYLPTGAGHVLKTPRTKSPRVLYLGSLT